MATPEIRFTKAKPEWECAGEPRYPAFGELVAFASVVLWRECTIHGIAIRRMEDGGYIVGPQQVDAPLGPGAAIQKPIVWTGAQTDSTSETEWMTFAHPVTLDDNLKALILTRWGQWVGNASG